MRLTVGSTRSRWRVPHTRPIGVTAHATRPELVAGHDAVVRQGPGAGSVADLLEFRLGQPGHDAMGFAVHVPHYLAQSTYPAAAVALLEAVAGHRAALPADGCARRPTATAPRSTEQVGGTTRSGVVRALEQQYDAFARRAERDSLLAERRTCRPPTSSAPSSSASSPSRTARDAQS